ncbi:hypothetical protein CXG81DRAFT_26887 [Caulochytrium protostelioides]|uniref:fructose-bisphosphatase n=1 Tax=Caulochytrium protostelioides TaxID=1555241 RepID=A0A4P9WWI1_9FUNG|nr:fructose-bisphosphatase [Caulochytrium protostelioides]RKP00420.1 hypothetical protein CXG81DRAFT_26887 [Caulochytrium protostelioides]|eukprot:RKP00420.1 hypothetical protein CXG81DRAFT_26887 [Caulochytrium protostelioides]
MSHPTESADTRTDITTVTQHILEQQRAHKGSTGDLSLLLTAIASACKWVSNVVRKAELLKVVGVAGTTNVQAEQQQKLDVLSNEIMINLLRGSGRTCLLVSEEDEDALFVSGDERGSYCVCFDPLDGSSNIDCGVAVGTIFGIYAVKDIANPTLKDVLRPGSEMIAAGYCMYGSSTVLVYTTQGCPVNGYTLDPNLGEFLLTHRNIQIGHKNIYSINEGNCATFDKAITTYLHDIRYPPKEGAPAGWKPYTARYVGSMVADMHRTLLYGGIFLYPGAKLRILYECFPMAFLVEHAGGAATDGRTRMLDIVPSQIHARSRIYLGTKAEVERIEQLYAELM